MPPNRIFKNESQKTMLKERTDSIIAIAAAVFFVMLVIYLSMQDSTVIGPL